MIWKRDCLIFILQNKLMELAAGITSAAVQEVIMSKSDMSTCIVCGKSYTACLSCRNQDRIKPWRSITDTIDCYKIFLIISQYNNGYVSKEEAKKQLEAVSFNKKNLKVSVQRKIDEIITGTEPVKKAVSKTAADK